MKEFSNKLLAKLLSKSESTAALKTIERLLIYGIPFNKPHGFKLLSLNSEECLMKVPFKRANKNHLGTVHACAIAALGEFPAGLLLIKNFSPARHRVVMTKLEVEYLKHGTQSLSSKVRFLPETFKRACEELSKAGSANIEMKSEITNQKGQVTALVSTTWQLKSWSLVKKH